MAIDGLKSTTFVLYYGILQSVERAQFAGLLAKWR